MKQSTGKIRYESVGALEIIATHVTVIAATEIGMFRNRRNRLNGNELNKLGTTRRSVSGLYNFRENTPLAYESTLERDFLIRMEFDLNVVQIESQPLQIPFLGVNGQEYDYTPDFLVYYQPGSFVEGVYPKPMLVEVKSRSEWTVHWREWMPKWTSARRYAIDQGWTFRIWDESRIQDQVLSNIRFLELFKRKIYGNDENNAAVARVSARGSGRVSELVSQPGSVTRMAELAHLWHLLAVRKLDCDMSLPLSDDTELWSFADEI